MGKVLKRQIQACYSILCYLNLKKILHFHTKDAEKEQQNFNSAFHGFAAVVSGLQCYLWLLTLYCSHIAI